MIRRALFECMGSFFLVFAASLTELPIAIGCVYIALLYTGWSVSGAHYSPAVSIGMWLRGVLPTQDLPVYIGAQFIGAVAALYLEYVVSDSLLVRTLDANDPVWLIFLIELLITTLFVYLFITVSTQAALKKSQLHGVIVGLASIGLFSMGGVLNPALGGASLLLQALLGGALESVGSKVLVYVVSCCAGGALAGLAYDFFQVPATGQFASVDKAD